MLASLLDECVREIVVRVQLSAPLRNGRNAILSTFEKAAWHKGF
jgi:hypothetical protein